MRGLPHAVYTLAREQGLVGGFFGGTAATVLKGAVNNCIRFACPELKKVFCAAGDAPTPRRASRSAGLAGATWRGRDAGDRSVEPQGLTRRYSGNLDCARQIIREKGVNGLYLGIKPRVLRVSRTRSRHRSSKLYSRRLDGGPEMGVSRPRRQRVRSGRFRARCPWCWRCARVPLACAVRGPRKSAAAGAGRRTAENRVCAYNDFKFS